MDTPDQPRPDVGDIADADLVLRTRSGDRQAFAELWRRHYRSGLTVASSITSSFDADDLVQEAYSRIYQAIAKGGGPTGSFRAYLFTSIRNTAAGWGRARRETAIDELEALPDPDADAHATDEALDRSLTHRAFRSLPTRWQEVLWYTEIEQMKPAEIAPLLGLKATAVAQLAFRAREGLREAWIQAHLQSVTDGSDCQWTIERLGAYARNNLGTRDHKKLEAHLAECARCTIVAAEATEVSHRLALVLLPLTIGAGAATAYLATLQGGSAPLVALAAGASGTVPGAVTVGAGSAPVAATGADQRNERVSAANASSRARDRSSTTDAASSPPWARCVRTSARTVARNSPTSASARRSCSREAARESSDADVDDEARARARSLSAWSRSDWAEAARSARRLFIASRTLPRTSSAMRRTLSARPASMPSSSWARAATSARPASVIS